MYKFESQIKLWIYIICSNNLSILLYKYCLNQQNIQKPLFSNLDTFIVQNIKQYSTDERNNIIVQNCDNI
jgi:hypothetical protein